MTLSIHIGLLKTNSRKYKENTQIQQVMMIVVILVIEMLRGCCVCAG